MQTFQFLFDRTWSSNVSSCIIKLKLGAIKQRRDLTYSYASSIRSRFVLIIYAIQIVADRLIPARQ